MSHALIDALRVSMIEETTNIRSPGNHPDRANTLHDPVSARMDNNGEGRDNPVMFTRATRLLQPPRHQLGRKFVIDRDRLETNPATTIAPPLPAKSVLEHLAQSRQPPVMYTQ